MGRPASPDVACRRNSSTRGPLAHGLSRHRDGVIAGVKHVGGRPPGCRERQQGNERNKASRVYLTAWSRRPTEDENIAVNAGIVRAGARGRRASEKRQAVALVTGLKHYLGPFEAYVRGGIAPPTPLREEQPRLDLPELVYRRGGRTLRRGQARRFYLERTPTAHDYRQSDRQCNEHGFDARRLCFDLQRTWPPVQISRQRRAVEWSFGHD